MTRPRIVPELERLENGHRSRSKGQRPARYQPGAASQVSRKRCSKAVVSWIRFFLGCHSAAQRRNLLFGTPPLHQENCPKGLKARPARSRRTLAKTTLIALATLTINAAAQPPAFTPTPIQSGTLRAWGNDQMRDILNAWQQAFHRHHPKITFEPTLYGSGTGMAGIITGTSDLALMGRPVTPNEVIGFEWVFRYKPLQIQVLTGSLAQPDHSPALAVFVSTQNPLRGLSMQQLATLLGCPGQKSTPTTWAAAGVEGPWSARPVHAFLPDEESGTGAFLQQTLLGAGPEAPDRWNWNVVHEFRDTPEATASEQILQALRQDPNALAVATLAHPVSGTRVLPINGIAPTRDTLIAASYPLTRGVYIDINRKPGTPIAPRLAEFLRFILSPEGQRIAATEGGFLPLNPVRAAEQANLLQ